jgi:hypothetical protein
MGEDTTRTEKNSVSGVTPVTFSAVTDTHDIAISVASDPRAMRKSPFGPDVPASGLGSD